MSTAKKFKTAAFSRVFTQNNSRIFLGKSKLNFWTKNEDFEQCVIVVRMTQISTVFSLFDWWHATFAAFENTCVSVLIMDLKVQLDFASLELIKCQIIVENNSAKSIKIKALTGQIFNLIKVWKPKIIQHLDYLKKVSEKEVIWDVTNTELISSHREINSKVIFHTCLWFFLVVKILIWFRKF